MEKFLVYEKNFLKVQWILSVALCVMTGLMVLMEALDVFSLLTALIILGLSIANSVLINFESVYTKRLFFVIKVLNLIALSMLLHSESRYVFGAAMLMYVFSSFELFITAGVDRAKKTMINLIVALPLIANAIVVLSKTPNVDVIIFVVIILFMCMAIYNVLFRFNKEFRDELDDQAHDLEESLIENLNLEESQKRLRQVYEAMSEQKYALEISNKKLDKMASEMYIQSELLQYITATLDIDQLLSLVTDSLMGATGCACCSIAVFEENNKDYYAKAQSVYTTLADQKFIQQIESGILDTYRDLSKVFIDDHVDINQYPFIENDEISSLVVTPIIRDGVNMGYMIIEHQRADYFTESSIDFFKATATQMNIAINNAKIYYRMEEMAEIDSLTNIYNRRAFQNRLETLYEQYKLENKRFSVILFDIDYFKKINDEYGHLVGDDVIKMVATTAKLYAEDVGGFAGRYGGEEFVMVLPKRNINQAYGIIATMHEEIKATLVKSGLVETYVDISIGITAFPEYGNSAEDLLNRADSAMYYAKEHGRGRIQVDLGDQEQ